MPSPDKVARAWMRKLVAKKPSEQLSEFRREVEGKRFRNPDTDNEVLFQSLPRPEQARIFSEWRRRQRGDEPRKERERGLIKVDKEDARDRAKHIAEKASSWKVRDPDEKIGDHFTPGMGRGYVMMGTLDITDVRGRRFERPLRLTVGEPNEELWRAGRKLTTGGRVVARHTDEKDPGLPMYVQVDLNPEATYADLAKNPKRLEQEVYNILIHEMTHAQDVLMTPQERKRHEKKHEVPEDTPDILRTEAENRAYYNKPTEVRAFKQQVADEVRRHLEKQYKDEEDPDWIGVDADAVMEALWESVTWNRVKGYLSGPNRRKFLETVASVARKFKEEKGGKVAAQQVASKWLCKVAKQLTFQEWVEGRRFKNPDTGRMILYKSLKRPYQEQIRAQWGHQERFEGESPRKPKRSEVEQSSDYGRIVDARSDADDARQEEIKKESDDLWKKARSMLKGKSSFESTLLSEEGARKLSRYILDNTLPDDESALQILATQHSGPDGVIARGIKGLTTDQIADMFGVRPEGDEPAVVEFREGRWVRPGNGNASSWSGNAEVAAQFAQPSEHEDAEGWDAVMVADTYDDNGHFVPVDYDLLYENELDSAKDDLYAKAFEKLAERDRKKGLTAEESVFLRVGDADDIEIALDEDNEEELSPEDLKKFQDAMEELEEHHRYAEEDLSLSGDFADASTYSQEEERLAVGPVKIARVYLFPSDYEKDDRARVLETLGEEMYEGELEEDGVGGTKMARKKLRRKPKKKPRVDRFNVPASDVLRRS